MPLYNVRTGLYENNEGKFETYSDAKKNKVEMWNVLPDISEP